VKSEKSKLHKDSEKVKSEKNDLFDLKRFVRFLCEAD